MGYTDHLISLLKPLRIYDLSNGSYNWAELEVLGRAFDECCSEIEILERECVVPTAEDYGLSMYERILPRNFAYRIDSRRKAIMSMLSVNNSSFTEELLSSAISGCGENTAVRESGEAFQVIVEFTDISSRPINYKFLEKWVENMLPCHLDVRYTYELTE